MVILQQVAELLQTELPAVPLAVRSQALVFQDLQHPLGQEARHLAFQQPIFDADFYVLLLHLAPLHLQSCQLWLSGQIRALYLQILQYSSQKHSHT